MSVKRQNFTGNQGLPKASKSTVASRFLLGSCNSGSTHNVRMLCLEPKTLLRWETRENIISFGEERLFIIKTKNSLLHFNETRSD